MVLRPASAARRRASPPCGGRLAQLLMPLAACAAGVAHGQTTVVPLFTATQTFTDNPSLTSGPRRWESITQLSPGIAITSRSARVQGTLNYSGNFVHYARGTQSDGFYNLLSAFARADLAEGRLLVDATASISQQRISAFGVQSADPRLGDRNRTEVRSYSIAPLLQGRLLGEVRYVARMAYSASHSTSDRGADSSGLTASIGISGPPRVVSWAFDANRATGELGMGRRTRTGVATASVIYTPDPEWRFSARAGREWNDLDAVRTQGAQATYGVGATWAPGPRTSAVLQADKRFFGHSHSVTLSHRFARTIWIYSDARDLSTNAVAGGRGPTLFDLYFQQFASQFPNPVQRELEVRNFLRNNNLDPNAAAGSNAGFLTSAATVQRRQNLSMSMQGLRTTFNVSAFRSQTERVGAAPGLGDDLALADVVRQSGYSVLGSYRLTPQSSASLSYTRQSTADAPALRGNDLTTIAASWSTVVGPHTAASVSLRHASFDSVTNPYQESAITGSLSVRF